MDEIREQFSRIYDQYIDKIYRFVYLKVSSEEVAQDITSKVFTKGWESYQKGIKNPGAFLYQVARNSVIDYYREKGRTNTVPSILIDELPDSRKSIEENAMLAADVNMVKEAISKLKKDYQDVLILHYLDDMPISQIAENLNKKEGTVRVMLHRGLKDLKDIIQSS
jgi:RNA polymerase sigma-70 factor (ECF subfamily)